MRECESCTTNLNTPAPNTHGPSNTNESHDIFGGENDKQYSIWTFRGVVFLGVDSLLLAGVLAFNGYILSYFEGKIIINSVYISCTQTTFSLYQNVILSVLSHEEIYLNICRNMSGVLTFVIHCIHIYIYIYIYIIYIYIYIKHTYTSVYIYIYIHTHIHKHMHIYIYIYTHTHTYAKHIYIYTRTPTHT